MEVLKTRIFFLVAAADVGDKPEEAEEVGEEAVALVVPVLAAFSCAMVPSSSLKSSHGSGISFAHTNHIVLS